MGKRTFKVVLIKPPHYDTDGDGIHIAPMMQFRAFGTHARF